MDLDLLEIIKQYVPAEYAVLTFSLGLVVIFWVAAFIFSLLAPSHVSTADRLLVIWLVYDVLTHVIMEGSFVYYSLVSTVSKSHGPLAELWKEYTRADHRWGVSDPTIVSLELVTVFFVSFLCILVILGIFTKRADRHYLQIILCTCELYGGCMTFFPEWLSNNINLAGIDQPFLHFFYLWFFNGLWVVIPLIMLYQSYYACIEMAKQPNPKQKKN